MSRSVSASGFGLAYRASTLSLPHESGLGLGSALGSTTCTALLTDASVGAPPMPVAAAFPMPLSAADVAQCLARAQLQAAGGDELLQQQPLTSHQLRPLDETSLLPECHSASTQSSNDSARNALHEHLVHADAPAASGSRTRFASWQHRISGQQQQHDDASECSCEQCRELLPLTQLQTLRTKTPVPQQLPTGSTCVALSYAQSKALTTFAPSPVPAGSQQHLPQGDYLPAVARATTPAPRGGQQ